MRGYFGIGSEGISKAMNLGAVLRTAHAFGASFAFTINANHRAFEVKRADTSASAKHLPLYKWASVDDMRLPVGCQLIGVELRDDAVELPVFKHPATAAYLLGPERGALSAEAASCCQHIVKIPTSFCVNLSVAAALVMYDRLLSLGGYPPRPVASSSLPVETNWRPLSAQKRKRPLKG